MTRYRHASSMQLLAVCAILIAMLSVSRAQDSPTRPPSESQASEGTTAKAPAVQPAKADAVAKPAGEGIPARVVDGGQVMGVLGKQVRSSAGEDMGRIVDVIIDRSARVRAAIIDFGGFLGVGNRQIAVAWNAIRLPADDKPGALVVDFTRDQLRVAPAYKAGEQVVLLGQPDVPPPAAGVAEKEPTKEVPTR